MSEKRKIVIIDDEPDLCATVKNNLEAAGEFEVTGVSNPATAEQTIKQVRPDLILLDVVMPGRKGTDIVAALRKDPEFRRTPIIIISGKGEMVYNKKKNEFKWEPNNKLAKERGQLPDAKGAEALAAAYGVNDYISKPFTTDILLEVINDVLAKSKKQVAAPEDDGGGPPV